VAERERQTRRNRIQSPHRSWQPDNSRRQRHVGLAVAYSVIQYAEASGDELFLADVGIDLVVDVARYFASMAILPLRHPRPSDIVCRIPNFGGGFRAVGPMPAAA
jgi:trehalose/maltose hydrolase-like predicted phosphorylase